MKRITSTVILLAMCTSLFSCGETAETTDTTVSVQTTEPLSMSEQRNSIADGLPDKDYNGETFNIGINTFCSSGFLAEELNGDVLSDAIFARNRAVEERFNVKLNYINEPYNDLTKLVKNSVLAGDDEYQLCAHHTASAATWVTDKILMNWNDIPYVDFTQPWWMASNITDLTCSGVNLLAAGDFALTTVGRTYCFYYDKVNAEAYHLPDMYSLVYEGKWTIDKLSELTRDVYKDLNSNGQRDFEDFYGFSTSVTTNVSAFMQTSGLKIIRDGKIILDVEKTTDLITRLIQIMRVDAGTFYDLSYTNAAGNNNYAGIEKMAAGTTLFCVGMVESGIVYLREANDYGIIPYPKWDEKQEDYYTIIDMGYTSLAVPLTVVDAERSGILATALCAETYKNVLPDYYELALKQKGTRDEDSIAMIDYVLSKRTFDFGLSFTDWTYGLGHIVMTMVKNDDPNFASWYASHSAAAQNYYDGVIEAFESYGK